MKDDEYQELRRWLASEKGVLIHDTETLLGVIAGLRQELETEQREWQCLAVTLERERDEARAALQWSSEPPTEPGLYWLWEQGKKAALVEVRIYHYQDESFSHVHWLNSHSSLMEDVSGQWAGPLLPPKEAL